MAQQHIIPGISSGLYGLDKRQSIKLNFRNMNNYLKKAKYGVGIMTLLILAFSFSFHALASDVERVPMAKNAGKADFYEGSIPESYNSFWYGKVTEPKDQKTSNSCWSFSVISCCESSLISSGICDTSVDLSEKHLTFNTFDVKTDPLNNYTGDYNQSDSPFYKATGNEFIALMTLASGKGPVIEEKVPFMPMFESPDPKYINRRDFTLDSSFIISVKDTEAVKRAIISNGCVAASVNYNERYYSKENHALYSQNDSCNHSVAIVGWDDNFSRRLFQENNCPESDGAWLVKNSYGTQENNNGVFWVSYCDQSLKSSGNVYVYNVTTDSTDDNIYMYDGSAAYSRKLIYSKGSVAATYTAKNILQKINKVSFALYTTGVSYKIQIYKNSDTANPESGTPMLSEKITGKTGYSGYYVIPVDQDIYINSDERFSVVITFDCNERYVSFFADESIDNISAITYVNRIDKNQAFVKKSADGSFVDSYDLNYTPRIKVFTSDITDHIHHIVPVSRIEPTCTKSGLTEGKICSICSEVIASPQPIPPTGHKPDNGRITVKSTCTHKGIKEYTCTVCGKVTEKQVITETGHIYKNIVTKATLTKSGKITPTCTSCGKTKTSAIIAYPKTFRLSATSFVYDGKAKKPTVTVSDSNGKTIASSNYTVVYIKNNAIGSAEAKVTFKGIYSGTKTLTFKIVPAQIIGLKAKSVEKTSVKLVWKKVSGASYYKIQLSTNGKKWKTAATVSISTATVSSLQAGTKYYFRVTALDLTKKIEGKASAFFKTQTRCYAPTVTLTSSRSKTATVSWKKVPGAAKYIIYQSVEVGKWVRSTTTTATSCTITKLAGGKKIYVKVVAVNDYGLNSAYSRIKSVTVKK